MLSDFPKEFQIYNDYKDQELTIEINKICHV